MSSPLAAGHASSVPAVRWTAFEQLRIAREVMQTESRAIAKVSRRLDAEFCRAADCLYRCRGSVIVTGIGKAGLIGQKMMATLASTGTRSHFLHPAEAVHGDLGRVHGDDVALVLLAKRQDRRNRPHPAAAGRGGRADHRHHGQGKESAGPCRFRRHRPGTAGGSLSLGAAPSSSTAAMLAVGDALALVVSRMKGFARDDFARFHPAGNLGLKLSKVQQHMRPLAQCRIAPHEETVRQVLVRASVPAAAAGRQCSSMPRAG